MNIFVTASCPTASAMNLDDKRLGKMITESMQMLSCAVYWHKTLPYEADRAPGYLKARHNYLNHPCTKWTRETRGNYDWLVEHAMSLAVLYESVCKKQHGYTGLLRKAAGDNHLLPDEGLTPFMNCTPYNTGTVFQNYRKVLCVKWSETDKRVVTFTNRPEPTWWIKYNIERVV